ncbi:MAG: 50S ribosomal protein L39e [Candidatus Micrarchaeia archaeon]
MSKKTRIKKLRLGKALKKSRRMPVVAIVKTHRRLQSNLFGRNWRRTKLHMKDE